jgi:probable phosphoglycerate mutase
MSLFVIRHAQTEWNLAGKVQGHTDVPLDSTGFSQAKSLARRFEGWQNLQILSSDLLRATQTAEEICKVTESTLTTTPALRERCLGIYEGKPWQHYAEYLEKMPDPLRDRIPDGESLEDVWNRIQAFLGTVNLEIPTVIVTHGGTAAVVMAQLLKGNLETTRMFRFSNTSFNEFRRRPDNTVFLHQYNCTAHLEELAIAGDTYGVAR